MNKNRVIRVAAIVAGGVVTMGVAAPAVAHETPAAGFNAVLHGAHHDRVATDGGWPDCANVVGDAGDAADELVKPGFDVWVFNAQSHSFDPAPAGELAKLRFTDPDGGEVVVTVPGGAGNPSGFAWWVGPAANPNKLAVSVPQGWTLADGDFLVQQGPGGPLRVVVTHTCPDQGEGTPTTPPTTPTTPTTPPTTPTTPPTGSPTTTPTGSPTTTPSASPTPPEPSLTPTPSAAPSTTPTAPPPGDNGQGGGLPVTGGQVGLLALAGLGLLGAGTAAMLLVRRKRSQFGLSDG